MASFLLKNRCSANHVFNISSYMFDHNQINKLINQSFEITADAYAEAQMDAMEARIYEWDGTTTYRKSGEVVTEPRDVVDTGELKDSLVELRGVGVRLYVYLAAHAAEVHQGYTTESGRSKPARPWTKLARELFIDIERNMGDELRTRFEKN